MISANPEAWEFQPENTIKLAPWDASSQDTVLLDLIPMLQLIATKGVRDTRDVVRCVCVCVRVCWRGWPAERQADPPSLSQPQRCCAAPHPAAGRARQRKRAAARWTSAFPCAPFTRMRRCCAQSHARALLGPSLGPTRAPNVRLPLTWETREP